MTGDDRFDEAFRRKKAKKETGKGSDISKILSALDNHVSTTLQCSIEDYASLQAVLSNVSDDKKKNIRISNSNGRITIDVSATPPKEPDKKDEKKNNKKENAEEKMDSRLDEDSKKKNKKDKKNDKSKDAETQKKTSQIKNEANERANKFDDAVNKNGKKANGAKLQKSGSKAIEKEGGKIARTAAAKGVDKTMAKAVGKTAAKTAAKTTTKIAGKAALKSLLKKIPGVSLAAGCVFAYQRIKDGDWKGAIGEVASGTLGCFPGIGTAASVALDTGLAVRDIRQADQPSSSAVKAAVQPMPSAVPAELRAEINQRGIPQKQHASSHAPSSLSAEQAFILQQQRDIGRS